MTTDDTPIARRQILSGSCALLVGAALPGGVLAATQGVAQQGGPLHEVVARKVVDLAAGRPVTLRLILPHGSGANLAPVIAAFEQSTGVSITLVETEVDEINAVITLDTLSEDQGFDVALPATFGVPDLVAAGALRSVSDYAARHEPDGFRDGILFSTGDSFDGEVYGFQADGDAYLMFYHREMLEDGDAQARYADQHGAALTIPQSWEELDRQMAFFHAPEEGRYGGLLFRTPGYLAWEWWVRFHAKGQWPLDPDMTPLIAGPAGVEALEDMIRASAHLAPEAAHLGLFGNWERYAKGDIYCNIGWGGTQKFLNQPGSGMKDRLRFGPTPGGYVDGTLLAAPYFNWGWSYVVASRTPEPEIAYLFALFASSPEMSTQAVREQDGFFDPYRPEHYEDPGIRQAYSEDFLSVHRDSLTAAIPDLYLKDQSAYFRVLGEWLTRALAGDVAPSMALDRVAFRWEQITNAAGRDVQTERWARLRGKYPAQMQRLLRGQG